MGEGIMVQTVDEKFIVDFLKHQPTLGETFSTRRGNFKVIALKPGKVTIEQLG